MARPRKWPPSILPHKPSGQDRIRVNGVDYPLGPIGSGEARREYARLVNELAVNGGAPPRPAAPAATVSAAAAAWLAAELPGRSAKEQAHYRRALLVLCRVAGDDPAADFDAGRLESVRDAMLSGSWLRAGERAFLRRWRKPEGWCARVANRQVVRIRTVWRWLERHRHAPKGSWAGLRTLRGLDASCKKARHRPRVRPATWEDLRAVLKFVRSPAARDMLLLQWWTGCRSGEARSMRAGEVDRSGEVWVYRPGSHKNAWRGHARAVPLGPEARKVLEPRLGGKGPAARVFTTRTGRPYRCDSYGQIACRAARKAGLPWFRPLCLRHGARVRITRELGLDAARAVLGHASADTTLHYGHGADERAALDAARKCG